MARTSWWRAPATLAMTLAVLCGELALLMWVYGLDDDVQARLAAHARVDGVVRTLVPTSDPAPLGAALGRLSDAGVDVTDVRAAGERWAASRSAADLAALRAAQEGVGDDLAAAARRGDLQVVGILSTLLVTVSIGWFVWFRRLVSRHRDLERQVAGREFATASERRLLALVHNSTDVIAVLGRDSTILFVSPAVERALGQTSEDLTGHRFVEVLVPDDRLVLAQQLSGGRSGEHPVTLRCQHPDGRMLVLEGTLANLLEDDAVEGFVLTVRDVTERHQLQAEIAHQAFHDSLTGLANRQLFSDRLSHALRPRESGVARTLHVLFLDLDDFKDVNDRQGHGVGDELLVVVGERISAVLRPGDTAARLGGDEFAVLLEESDLAGANAVAERVLAAIHQPVVLGRVAHQVRASIGIAAAVPGITADEEAMRNADVAMYMAKGRGKGSVAVYDPAWHQRSLDVLDLRHDLQWAIDSGELVLHYQPTIDLREQRVTGFEALVRWQHPERGLIPPADFIPVAEQSGLIVPLGRWVLGEACRAATTLREVDPDLSMSVNVSVQQLARSEFVRDVVDALDCSGLPPSALVLEITESALMDDAAVRLESLTRLRHLGVRVAIDDFGTGYSSLSQLTRLPVDVLKVDKSFVDHLGTDGAGATLVRAILAMSSSLHLTTVAEGVEGTDQAAWLRESACAEAQGFLWSPPVALDEALALAGTTVAAPQEAPVPLRAIEGGLAAGG